MKEVVVRTFWLGGNKLINVINKTSCCGCNACCNICPTNAIQMINDEKGFLFPSIDKEKCINCGMCEKVCPMLVNKHNKNNPIAYACYNKDEKIRMESSSGGIFTLLAINIINHGGVVFGASFNNENLVEHICIDNIYDLYKLRGSKYLQSNTNTTYKEVKGYLDKNVLVLYTGTPCQIEGLLSYLQIDYENLYTQDIICHGVPSPKVWKKYLEFRLGDNKDKIIINFRDKSEGWSNFNIVLQNDSIKYKNVYKKDLYLKAFLKDICLRDSCYNCKFKKLNRLSDITLGDFWGISEVLPEMNDDKGTSLVIVNSKKARGLFDKISTDIIFKEVELDTALEFNPMMIKSSDLHKNREKFFENLDKLPFKVLIKKCLPGSNILGRTLYKIMRIFK